jgi:hypothetical protein
MPMANRETWKFLNFFSAHFFFIDNQAEGKMNYLHFLNILIECFWGKEFKLIFLQFSDSLTNFDVFISSSRVNRENVILGTWTSVGKNI